MGFKRALPECDQGQTIWYEVLQIAFQKAEAIFVWLYTHPLLRAMAQDENLCGEDVCKS